MRNRLFIQQQNCMCIAIQEILLTSEHGIPGSRFPSHIGIHTFSAEDNLSHAKSYYHH